MADEGLCAAGGGAGAEGKFFVCEALGLGGNVCDTGSLCALFTLYEYPYRAGKIFRIGVGNRGFCRSAGIALPRRKCRGLPACRIKIKEEGDAPCASPLHYEKENMGSFR